MKLRHLSIQRSIAIVLSISAVWLMVACMSLCSSHCSEPEMCETLASAEIDATHETDCCPITTTPVSLMPERLSFSLQVNSDQVIVPPTTQLSSASLPPTLRIGVPYPSSSPPLSQSCVLRI